jgi:hypothetical protein
MPARPVLMTLRRVTPRFSSLMMLLLDRGSRVPERRLSAGRTIANNLQAFNMLLLFKENPVNSWQDIALHASMD